MLVDLQVINSGEGVGNRSGPSSDYVSRGCPKDGFGPASNCRAVTVGLDVADDRAPPNASGGRLIGVDATAR